MGDEAVTPTVAVVVPVKNRTDLLAELVDALRKQTFSDFEVVVVDDGSSPPLTPELLRDLAAGDGRFRVITSPGEGAVAARSAGVAATTTPYLAFTDSDCVPDAGWLDRGCAALDGGADVVQGVTLPQRPVRAGERSVYIDRFDGLYATCNTLYRRSAFDRAGGFDPSAAHRLGFRPTPALRGLGFGEDALVGWRVARTGSSSFVADAVVRHHVFPADLRESVRRAWLAGGFPTLVREVPELRDTFLSARLFVGGTGRVHLYVAALFALAGRRRMAAVAAALWAAGRAREVTTTEPQRRRWPVAVAHACATDAVAAAALVSGSVRSRTPVL